MKSLSRALYWQIKCDPSNPVAVTAQDVSDTFEVEFIGKMTPLQTQHANWTTIKLDRLADKSSSTVVRRLRSLYGERQTTDLTDSGRRLSFELYIGGQTPAARFNVWGFSSEFAEFDRPGKEGLLALVQDAERGFVEPLWVKDQLALFLVTEATEPDEHRVQGCFANETKMVSKHLGSAKKQQTRSSAEG